MIDLDKTSQVLAELGEVEEKIADRGPIKVLPRPREEIPNIPRLQEQMAALFEKLKARRNYTTPKGHDLDGSKNPVGYDLTAVGRVEEIRTVPKGKDRANPDSTTLVRVLFSSGESLWFDPSDLEAVP